MRRPRFLISGSRVFSFYFLCLIFLVGAGQTKAEVFTIDPSQSRITLSGTVEGLVFSAQQLGSLTTTYTGNLNATDSGSTIQFTGSSTIAAITNGIWQPGMGGAAGSAPADYGAQVSLPLLGTGYGAGRNIVLDMTSPLLILNGTNFDSSQLVISLVTNSSPVLDYHTALTSGAIPVYGRATNSNAAGSFISASGGLTRLVIKISATLSVTNNSTLTLTGEIVATNSLLASVPPVITSIVATHQDLVLTVSNATTQSLLLSSTNLTTWSPDDAAMSTNDGSIIFTTPISGSHKFFRVQR